MDELKNQECPVCHKKTATLIEDQRNFPKFQCFLFSISCSSCNYHKSDIELEPKKENIECSKKISNIRSELEPKQQKKQTIEIKDSKQLKTQIAKSSEAIIKIPQIKLTIKPDVSANGYITTISGLISKYKKELEQERDSADSTEDRKKAKNQLKKLWKVEWGDVPIKVNLEDKSGNSAII